MLDSLRKIGREFNRAWESLAEGWRDLISRASNALTHFRRDKSAIPITVPREDREAFPNWGLAPGEVYETDDEIVVRMEVPGMEREDFDIIIDGNTLYVRGEKRYAHEAYRGRYYILERAYGRFQRAVPLPRNTDAANARAEYRRGVLTLRLPTPVTHRAKKRIAVQ